MHTEPAPRPEPSSEALIPEDAFAEQLAVRGRRLRRMLAAILDDDAPPLSKATFADLLRESEELESFLDDSGARWNRTFAPVTELVAGVRALAGTGFHLSHVRRRLEWYRLAAAVGADTFEGWRRSVHAALTFTRRAVGALGSAALEALVRNEARAGGGEDEAGTATTLEPPGPASVELPKLPRTLHHDEPVDEEQKIARVATDYLDCVSSFRRLDEGEATDDGAWVREHFSEADARTLTARVHNLQSAYDTWIGNTVLEAKDPRLLQLRGHTSLALHLLQAATHLVHFRERYESEQRSDEMVSAITALVRPSELDGVVRHHLVEPAVGCLRAGEATAGELVPSYTNVQERSLKLREGVRLHARPAALIANVVRHHGTPVELLTEGRRCNAGSILELLMTVSEAPEAEAYVFRGDERPLEDLAALFEADLGEHGLDSLPERLAYLRQD